MCLKSNIRLGQMYPKEWVTEKCNWNLTEFEYLLFISCIKSTADLKLNYVLHLKYQASDIEPNLRCFEIRLCNNFDHMKYHQKIADLQKIAYLKTEPWSHGHDLNGFKKGLIRQRFHSQLDLLDSQASSVGYQFYKIVYFHLTWT